MYIYYDYTVYIAFNQLSMRMRISRVRNSNMKTITNGSLSISGIKINK